MMADENPQSEVFRKILEDLEKLCEANNKIKESVKTVDVNKEESVDETYESIQSSLETNEKALSEIVNYVKRGKEQWTAQKKNKQLNGDVETKNEVGDEVEKKPKVGLLKLVSLDKLLDPSLLNEKTADDSVIVLSDAEPEDKTSRKRTTVSRKSEKQLNNKSKMPAYKPRPLRHKTKHMQKTVISSSDSEEETIVKYNKNRNKRGRRKRSDSSASDAEFVVTKKVKKPEQKKKIMSGSDSDGKKVVDEKIHWKAYVPLPRVQCEKLKEYYAKKIRM